MEVVVRSAREHIALLRLLPASFQQAPDSKPGAFPQSQPQTLNALSLPFFRVRFVVGCGGGRVVLYLSHASFVSGIIINPFFVVGSLIHMPGLSLNITFPSS